MSHENRILDFLCVFWGEICGRQHEEQTNLLVIIQGNSIEGDSNDIQSFNASFRKQFQRQGIGDAKRWMAKIHIHVLLCDTGSRKSGEGTRDWGIK
jgi:hypothetical protein